MVDNFRIICLIFLLRFVKPDVLNIIYLGYNKGPEPSLLLSSSTVTQSVCYLHVRMCLSSCSPPHASSYSFIIGYALRSQYKLTSVGFSRRSEERFPFRDRSEVVYSALAFECAFTRPRINHTIRRNELRFVYASRTALMRLL